MGLILSQLSFRLSRIFSQWKEEDVPHKMELKQVWVHVFGVPCPLRHFLGLWAVGSLIGSTLDVDLLALRRRGIVRILVAMSEVECFNKEADEFGPNIKTDGVLRTKGYDFTFHLESPDFNKNWKKKYVCDVDDNLGSTWDPRSLYRSHSTAATLPMSARLGIRGRWLPEASFGRPTLLCIDEPS